MDTEPSNQTLAGVAFGDLHLLAGRQRRFRSQEWMPQWRRGGDLCVLNGDIFDFRWAEEHDERISMRQARRWLEQLIHPPVRSRFIVIMGNHDSLPGYREVLEDLAERHAHFRWAEHWVRLGDKVFFHGDFPDDTGAVERLRESRREHTARRRPGKGRRGLYWAATKTGLTGMFPRVLRWRRYCLQSNGFLARELGAAYNDIRHVYLGHTHVHFQDLELNGRLFHNSGTPLRGAAFRPLHFHFGEVEWKNLSVG